MLGVVLSMVAGYFVSDMTVLIIFHYTSTRETCTQPAKYRECELLVMSVMWYKLKQLARLPSTLNSLAHGIKQLRLTLAC